jgi:hypothetical protein
MNLLNTVSNVYQDGKSSNIALNDRYLYFQGTQLKVQNYDEQYLGI